MSEPNRKELRVRMNIKSPIFYGWWVVASLYAVGSLGPTARYALSVLSPFMQETLLWTKTQIGLAFSIHLWIYSFMVLIAGWMIDNLGGRKTICLGGIALLVTMMTLSRVSSLLQFYVVFGMILPFGVSLTHYVPTQSISRKWFRKRAGLIGGIMATAFGIGVGLLSPVLSFLAGSLGWRTTWMICGVSFGGIIMLSALVIRDTPESIGLRPDGMSESLYSKEGGNVSLVENELRPREVFGTLPFWLLVAAFALIAIPLQGLLTNLVIWAVDLGRPITTASVSMTCFLMPSIPAKIVGGWLGDTFSKKAVLIYGNLACMLIMIYAGVCVYTGEELLVAAGLMGAGYGISLGLFAPYLGDMFGRAFIGSLVGVMTLAHTFVGGFGSLMWGILRDLTGSYNVSCLISALCYALVVILLLFIKSPSPKQAIVRDSNNY